MNNFLKGFVPVAAIGLVVILCFGGYSCYFKSKAVEFENGIKYQDKEMQNVYDNFWKEVQELAQVPDMYRDDVMKVFEGVLKNRYGEEGSKAMWQWIQEHNPNIPADIYTRVQDSIQAGRARFTKAQTRLLDLKNQYENFLQKPVNDWFAARQKRPRIDLSKYDILTSEKTSKAFDTKKDEPIKIRK
jgi:hypothetical protein